MKKLGRISYHILVIKKHCYYTTNLKLGHFVNSKVTISGTTLPDTKIINCIGENGGIKSPNKMAEAPIDCDFPVWGLLPKKETGVVSFLNKNPEYDGRNTIIAILDSGVDPAADGLKVTSTGETKVIERFDCSGCGDVDTTTIIRKVVDGCITGVTGRKLQIPESWNNPSGEWRVGVLYPYQLYPTKVKERMQEYRKEHLWNVGHKPAFAESNKRLQEFENEIAGKGAVVSNEDKQMKEELEARVEALQNADKKYTDLGPTYDCVLFHDGTVWRACIDTSECGELASNALLGEYSVTKEHTHLTEIDEMTISINVHDEGNTLEVVGMCSTHGTHVAAISAGYFEDEPDRNGVAPGAKIVSLTIGDSRLGSMETGTALVRACIKVMELSKKMKIDVINMSYGEHAHWSHAGRIGEIMCTVVSRFGVSWVVSAGNHGPALCTVGAPPDIVRPLLIGVGAYVSPELWSAAYSLRARVCGGAFSWSSRGPAADGAPGLALCAPGAALTAVARFTLRNSQLMNGTSMAAPHVAGAVAALISGLKAKSLPYSPFSIKRALENSATYMSHVEPWAQGCGLLNVEKAFDILTSYYNEPERDVSFAIQCGSNNAKGILLRPKIDDVPKDIPVTIEPVFMYDHNDEDDKCVIGKQISFGVRLALACPADWVSAPRHLDLSNAARPLAVRLDPAHLPPGPHYASIDAYDVKCVDKGPVFRIAVTVLKPQPLSATVPVITEHSQLFKPSTIKRHIVIPPEDATWGVLKLQTSESDKTGRFLIHIMQILPRMSCRSKETQKMVSLTSEAPTILPFQVTGGIHLEVVIAKYWANIGDMNIDYTVEFHGIKADCGPKLYLSSCEPVTRLTVKALRLQDVAPTITIKYMEPVVRPTESKISPLTARDIIPPARQIYQLINTYTFNVPKATDVSPIVCGLSDMLYESELEAQMWMMYNHNKQLLAVGDAYPAKYSVKVEKGEYTLRLNIRHDNKSYLEKFQDLPVCIQQKLSQPITLDVYTCKNAALTGGKKFTSTSLSSGSILPLYISTASSDKLVSSGGGGGGGGGGGAALGGSATLGKDDAARRAALPVWLPAEPRRAPRDKPRQDDYRDAYREFVASWLPKLEGDKLEQAYSELVDQFPTFLGAHVAYLQALDNPTDAKKLPHVNVDPDVTTAWCEQLIAIADKVINQIDQDKLLAYLGMKNDTRADATKIKAEHEKQKSYLLEALSRRGTALCRLQRLQRVPRAAPLAAAAADNLQAVLRLADLADAKVIHYAIWHYFTLKQWGRAVKLLTKLSEDRPSKEVDERLIEVYTELKWTHLAQFTQAMLPNKYPNAYRSF